jgi:hypothetical protein
MLARTVALVAMVACTPAVAAAQGDPSPPPAGSATGRGALFLAGGAVALGAHEGGHLLFDIAFDADPSLTRVDFHGIPFFAITPQASLTPRRGFVVSSAGFWVQHATDEWLLTRRPNLRRERAPFTKGVLAFNVLASAAYAGAAFGRTGPQERDTLGMSTHARIDERWIGALVLAPAVFDSVRYFNPDARWAAWASRGVKIGLVLLVVR